MKKTCFSIMPFEERFEDIDQIIAESSQECGFEYIRGDRRLQPGSILPQIMHDIRQASVVVADITAHNPNVFYELGIAHQIKGPERVVILTQSAEDSPYDVHEFRQLCYQHNKAGRAALRKMLPNFLKAAAKTRADQEMWSVVRGRLPRTRLLVRDLQRLVDSAGPNGLKGVTIRIVAGLGSLAISNNEPSDLTFEADYYESLIAERNMLRKALLQGACMRAVINPPRRFAQAMLPERLRVRFERLIGLLEGRSDIADDPQAVGEDLAAIKQCEFVLSPVPMPNLFIIGEMVAYEGMKRGGSGGFDMTHCETSADGLRDLIQQFDRLFDDSRRDMVRTHPPDGRLVEQLKIFYSEATGLE
ncbi:MAG: hypothetical protein ACD_75C02639G0003 [uncultured bacterium]|nr:MAG: hypothetical protein ACD_75C02639G0003 [uncultured bacterium]HBG18333.1 hypothetical protein [Desulfobulbaceae bacterium]